MTNQYRAYQSPKTGLWLVWDLETNKTRTPVKSKASEGAPDAQKASFADAFAEVMTLNDAAGPLTWTPPNRRKVSA